MLRRVIVRYNRLLAILNFSAVFIPLVIYFLFNYLFKVRSKVVRTSILGGVVSVLIVFSKFLVSIINITFSRLREKNKELLMLQEASLSILRELSLEPVLNNIVKTASSLLKADYGAIVLFNEKRETIKFCVYGMKEEDIKGMKFFPQKKSVSGAPIFENRSILISDVAAYSELRELFPERYRIGPLMGVAIKGDTPVSGNIYLARKRGSLPFASNDLSTLSRFAVLAALAIDNSYLHQLAKDSVALAERKYIAQEIHDSVAQLIAYVNMEADIAMKLLSKGQVRKAFEDLKKLKEAAKEAYGNLRAQVLDLRFTSGAEDLDKALKGYLDKWRAQNGIEVECKIRDIIPLKGMGEMHFLRIVQEALSNVRKHSQASKVVIESEGNDRFFYFRIRDNGIGKKKSKSKEPSFGIEIMKERAKIIGGELNVIFQEGVGTTVELKLPR